MVEVLITKLIIPKKQQYSIKMENKNINFFEYGIETYNNNIGNTVLIKRDIHCDIKKNILATLKELASIACIKGYSKMKKTDLVKELNNRIIFE